MRLRLLESIAPPLTALSRTLASAVILSSDFRPAIDMLL